MPLQNEQKPEEKHFLRTFARLHMSRHLGRVPQEESIFADVRPILNKSTTYTYHRKASFLRTFARLQHEVREGNPQKGVFLGPACSAYKHERESARNAFFCGRGIRNKCFFLPFLAYLSFICYFIIRIILHTEACL